VLCCLACSLAYSRWISSKATHVIHSPQVMMVDAFSLSYPPLVPATPKPLVVGKTHQTPVKPVSQTTAAPVASGISPPTPSTSTISTPTPSPAPKMTHRQRYEMLLSQTTRPAPYILSTCHRTEAIVRSDPLSGKVSKGFWGPHASGELSTYNFMYMVLMFSQLSTASPALQRAPCVDNGIPYSSPHSIACHFRLRNWYLCVHMYEDEASRHIWRACCICSVPIGSE